MTISIVQDAVEHAGDLVRPLGRRWQHVQAVAARAQASQPRFRRRIEIAWSQQPGCTTLAIRQLSVTPGFIRLTVPVISVTVVGQPRSFTWSPHHSGARFKAAERGLTQDLSEFPFEDSPALDALVMADLTTGPGGKRLTYDERIAEILRRYAPEDPVHRTWLRPRRS